MEHGHRGRDDRVGAEAVLVWRAVERDHGPVDTVLVTPVAVDEQGRDLRPDRLDRSSNIEPAKRLTAVPAVERLSRAG